MAAAAAAAAVAAATDAATDAAAAAAAAAARPSEGLPHRVAALHALYGDRGGRS